MTTDAEIALRSEHAREERAFWDAHYLELLAQFPDEWVAVCDGKVITRAEHIWELIDDLRARGIDPRDAWITFLNATHRSLCL